MKEISGSAHNIFYNKDMEPNAEIILVLSEPTWRLSPDDIVRERESENVRIVVSKKSIKSLIKILCIIEEEMSKSNVPKKQKDGE